MDARVAIEDNYKLLFYLCRGDGDLLGDLVVDILLKSNTWNKERGSWNTWVGVRLRRVKARRRKGKPRFLPLDRRMVVDGPGKKAENKEIWWRAVMTLEEKERVVLWKAYYKGLTLKQIGEEMSIGEKVVRKIRESGLRKVRNIVGRD